MLAQIRKALVAGVGAGMVAASGVLAKASHLDRETVSQAIGAFVASAALVGYTAWRVPND